MKFLKNKKGTIGKGFIIGLAVFMLIGIFAGTFALMKISPSPAQLTAVGGTSGGTSGGVDVSGTITTTSSADTISAVVTGSDKIRSENGQSVAYQGFSLRPIVTDVNGVLAKRDVVQVASTATGGTATGIPVTSKNVRLIADNTSAIYATYFDIANPKSGITYNFLLELYASPSNGDIYAGLSPFTSLPNSYSSTYQYINTTNLSLTAGGAGKTARISMQLGSSYKQYGQKGIVVGCDQIDNSRYEVAFSGGTSIMTNGGISLPAGYDATSFSMLTAQNKKVAWLLDKKVFKSSEALTDLFTITPKLLSGQSNANINCTIYDVGDYVSVVDSMTIKTGINNDASPRADIGADNPSVILVTLINATA